MNELSIDRRDFQPGKTANKLNEMIISTSSALVILKTVLFDMIYRFF